MSMPPILAFENVSFAYDGFPVLRNVSFHIDEGEYVGIIGPNGGGKTTLFKLILGFLKPTHGKILFYGKPTADVTDFLAYVPQTLRHDRQFPISVLEVVLGGLLHRLPWYGRFSKKDHEDALCALDKVGLREFQNRQFGTLSLGQTQRVLIARAIVSRPKLLLLDEPTASVDSHSEAEIHKILASLRNEITLLMVTHDIRTIIQDVQRVILVQNEVSTLNPAEVCEHFALGVYHTPLVKSAFNSSQEKKNP
jgi:zinc transport system ATP-binding protein